jgi:hypothetical protein
LAEAYERLRSLHEHPLGIYTLDGLPATENPDGIWIFDTLLTNHLALQLAPDAVERLTESGGVLLSHCYMGAQHPYGGSNCFDSDTEHPKLLKKFIENIEYIGELQQKKKIVTLPFMELRQHLSKLYHTNLLRDENKWIERENGFIKYGYLNA